MTQDQEPSLFPEAFTEASPASEIASDAPLAARMRPRTLDEVIGQERILGADSLLRRAIQEDRLTSCIFWGPPGCGKSTLAAVIASTTRSHFDTLSAVTAGIPELRALIARAKERRRKLRQRTVLFVDEIHRWNRAQQDALLPHVEDGTIILIGATTENPYFEINAPLISRSRIFRFERLSDAEVRHLIERAAADEERGLGALRLQIEPEALEHLVAVAGGDARNALNALESAAAAARPDEEGRRRIGLALAEEAVQQRALAYDKSADEHYDTISAFIKSVRGSDPDAAVYWLAKMLDAGEDPKFIARRLLILASEDIGNAEPMGLVLAAAAAQAVQFVGMPEAQLILAQATTFLAAAQKSNASAVALWRAQQDLRTRGAAAVPAHLRSTAYQGAAKLGHGAGYKYPHDFPGGWVEQEYLPPEAQSQPYYEPTDRGIEQEFRERFRQRSGGAPPST